jgi:DNA polymerase (family 10)/putative hydrolase
MKTWRDGLVNPILGDFHIHTCYSDGADTIDAYCQRAKINELTYIGFTEHVRKKLSYNFSDYLSEIAAARENYPELAILAGCETKVIDRTGNLDAQKSVIDSCDFVTAVFHSFPSSDKETYLEALGAMLTNPVVDIWGHPTLFAERHGFQLNRDEIAGIIETCIRSDIIIEINLKYSLPRLEFLKIACTSGAKFIVGSDAHAVDELLNKEQLVKLWKKIIQMC